MPANRNSAKSFFEEPETSATPNVNNTLSWRDLELQTKAQLVAIYGAKVAAAFAWAGSFSAINKSGSDVFLADMIPLPQSLVNLTLADLTSAFLGILSVVIPSVAFHFALKYPQILRDVRGYFSGQIERIMVAALILGTWMVTIVLEILSLQVRMDGALNTGPIPVLGDAPEFWPLFMVSAALVLASSLLGLASAALSISIARRRKALHSI